MPAHIQQPAALPAIQRRSAARSVALGQRGHTEAPGRLHRLLRQARGELPAEDVHRGATKGRRRKCECLA